MEWSYDRYGMPACVPQSIFMTPLYMMLLWVMCHCYMSCGEDKLKFLSGRGPLRVTEHASRSIGFLVIGCNFSYFFGWHLILVYYIINLLFRHVCTDTVSLIDKFHHTVYMAIPYAWAIIIMQWVAIINLYHRLKNWWVFLRKSHPI